MSNTHAQKSFSSRVSAELKDFQLLFRNIPSLAVTFFFLSVVCANLMANKELVSYKFVALDCGFIFSWIMFLCMDVICKRWGPKASIKVSIVALLVNLATCGIFYLLSLTPGMWGEFYSFIDSAPETATAVNNSLNATFGGSWYIVLGSGLAFITSSVVNAFLNATIGRNLKKDNFVAFAIRSYSSTILAQFVDNFIFATVVSKIFFGWTWTQVLICSCIGAVCELLAEVLFSGLGYKVVKEWERDGVGSDYLNKNS